MGNTSGRIKSYYRHYDEWGRLARDQYHKLEFETTLHFLRKHLPRHGLILDAGGGPGRYTIELARLGYDVILFDLMPELLGKAREQVKKAGVEERVKGYVRGSIHDMSRFETNKFDGVLCLGAPLNHLLDPKQREKAIDELVRVAKKNAPICISVIGRLSNPQTGLVKLPGELERYPEVYVKMLTTGDYDGSIGFAPCHFFLLEELEGSLKKRHLRILNRVGLEGLASKRPDDLERLAKRYPNAWKAWMKIHLETCTHPAVVATSEHFMVICRK